MRTGRFALTLALALSALALSLGSAGASDDGGQWRQFTPAEGLPAGEVLTLAPAREGAFWVGTAAGAARYDGEWLLVTDRDGLPSARVQTIAESPDGAVWFGTPAGVARRAPGGACCRVWDTGSGLPSNEIRSLLVTPDASARDGYRVWVGTDRGSSYLEGSAIRLTTPVPGAAIRALAPDPAGGIYAGVEGGGIWRWSQSGHWKAVAAQPALGAGITTLLTSEDGVLWAGTEGGLRVSAIGKDWEAYPLASAGAVETISALARDRAGGLWVGSTQGLTYDADASPGGRPQETVSLPGGSLRGSSQVAVRGLLVDASGGVWVAWPGGVGRYDGAGWRSFEGSPVASLQVSALVTDRLGRTWAGTRENGLFIWDGLTWQSLGTTHGLPDAHIIALHEDRGGRIWVSTASRLGFLNPDGQWWFFPVAAPGLPALPVYDFWEDSSGALWLAAEGGLVRWDEARGLEEEQGLSGKRVMGVAADPGGALRAAVQSEGLLIKGSAGWRTLATGGGLAALTAPARGGLVIDDLGGGWAVADDGTLWRGDGAEWQSDASAPKGVRALIAGPGGSLWAGGAAGLWHFDGVDWRTVGPSALSSAGVTAVSVAPDGAVWVGTTAGPWRYRAESEPPWVSIESINGRTARTRSAQLWGHRVETVAVRGGDLVTPKGDLVYLVGLDGTDGKRIVTKGTQVSALAGVDLKPGDHVLRVWAMDAVGNLSQPAEMRLVVPRMVSLPGGAALPAVVVYPVAGVAATAVAGATFLTARRLRRRVANGRAEARRQSALARAFNPFIQGGPVRDEAMLFGREELFQRVLGALHQNNVMIHGERRMGKTSLLLELAERLRRGDDPEWEFVPVYVDLEGTTEERFFHALMDAILSVVGPSLRARRADLHFGSQAPTTYTDRDFAADLRVVIGALRTLVSPRRVRFVLLLDEVDVLNGYGEVTQQQFRRTAMSSVADSLGTVVAGTHINKAWNRVESPWYNLFIEIPLEPLASEASRALLTRPISGTYAWDSAALDFVLENAHGRPFRLQQYGFEAVNHMLAAGRTRITLEDVMAADPIVQRARKQQETEAEGYLA